MSQNPEKNLLHTFVICAYKESGYLEECIKSLMNQTIKSEVILYTSTPNESINRLALKYDIIVFNGDGSGIGSDWNRALACVNTQYATIAHQDDIYLPDYAKNIMRGFQKQAHNVPYAIAFCNYREIRNAEVIPLNLNLHIKSLLLFPLRVFPSARWTQWFGLAFGCPICCPAVSYNMEELHNFKFSETMRVSLDWDAWFRIYKSGGKFCYIPKTLMYHRIHDESETTNMIAENLRTIEDYEMYQKLWPKFISKIIARFYKKSQESNKI